MLDLGFREDLEFILDAAPAERRTLMFSATVPRAIATLAKGYQRDAVRITAAGEDKQHHDIEYRALSVAPADRENAIINVLRYYEARNALVFCNTRAAVNHLTARFNNRNFSVVALSGELSQNERSHALQAMRDGRARVCIATDVAARGIDLPNLELVIHADLPTNPETLLHRSGRTGRAGRKGVSAIIIPYSARRRAERLLHNAAIKAEWASPPSADEVMQRDNERMLADPAFAQPIREEERAFVDTLLETHNAEQIATAFLRLSRAGRSAPEDLAEPVPFKPSPERGERGALRDEKPGRRDDFGDSVWFSLSVGRRQNAEPRWLIPMLCRTGDITKREIGAIRMQPEESFVQIAAASADRFFAAIGPDHKVQGNILVKRLDGQPDLSRAGYNPPKPGKKPHRGKGNFAKGNQDGAGPKRAKPAPVNEQKPWAAKPGKPKSDKSRVPKARKKKMPE
jgi:ATP-dependent RNA helicase DeaD